MGNLIQTLPINKPQTQQIQPSAKKPVQNTKFAHSPFDNAPVYSYAPARPLSPANTKPIGVRPQAPAGHLIKENIFQSMGSTVKSYVDYAKYFYKAAFKGEGSDYSVGKINDLAIRAGSLGIAGVLSTSKMFPFAKGMEFVGLGTWFAAMAIWPRVLAVPIKMKTGVDINQRYEDSLGRRKFVLEDNQYRPMDIYRHADLNGKPLTPEEYYAKYDHDYVYLEKKGDQLGIPRDIKNRNEAIMNKIGQVGVQGRTLSMLTAGVMTPVISSLVADALQDPLKNHLEKQRYNKEVAQLHELDGKLQNLLDTKTYDVDKIMQKLDIKLSPEMDVQLKALLPESGQLSPEEYKKLSEFLNKNFFGTGFKEAIDYAMSKNAIMTEPHISLSNEMRIKLKDFSKEVIQEVISGYNENGKALIPDELKNFKGIDDKILDEVIKESENVNVKELNTEARKTFKRIYIQHVRDELNKIKNVKKAFYREFKNSVDAALEQKFDAYVESRKHYIIPKQDITRIIKYAEINKQLQAKVNAFESTSIKNISESMTANNWAKVPAKYLKQLGFTKGELAIIATQEGDVASKVISKKLEQIAANPEKYQKVVASLTEYAKTAISKEEKAVIELIGTANKRGTLGKISELMISVAENQKNNSMSEVIRKHYRARNADIQRKFRNTIDSFVKPIKALELYKDMPRIVKKLVAPTQVIYDEMIAYDKASNINKFYPFHSLSYSKACDTMEKHLKDIILQKNDVNGWTTKLEHDFGNTKQGFNQTLEMVRRFSNVLFSDMNADTAGIIKDADFVERCNINNTVLKARYMRIVNELSEAFKMVKNDEGKLSREKYNYMMDSNFFDGLITEFRFNSQNKKLYDRLLALADDRVSDLPLSSVEKCKDILKQIKLNKPIPEDDIAFLYNNLKDFKSTSKSMCEMSGKNITDFFVQAAQDIRSRSKWTKLVYGLLIGTGVVSAVTIALIGKKNHFNKDIYEPLDTPQGAGK